MKKLIALAAALTACTTFASNYPPDYCNATVWICKDGPGVVAQISSGCNTGIYVIGYKKSGSLGNNSSLDAVVKFDFGNSANLMRTFQLTPDWQHLGLMTSPIDLGGIIRQVGNGSPTAVSVAFSNGNGDWDSKGGANYYYPMSAHESPNCYTVRTSEPYFSEVPFVAWDVVNEAMSR
jgi:hypothetical protein